MNWDSTLFTFFNQPFAGAWLDPVMAGITTLGHTPWVFVPLWLALLIKGGKKGQWVCALMIPLLLASDMIPTYILKPLFSRLRPHVVLEGVRLLGTTPDNLSQYCFPSNHASNIFALCSFLCFAYRKKALWIGLGTLSGMVSFSRIYVGAHYPLDVVAGALFGITLGYLTFLILNRIRTP